MATFILFAAMLAFAVAALVAVPLWRKRADAQPAARGAALASVLIVVLGGAIAYLASTNYSWAPSDRAAAELDTPQTMVARLARRLEKNPDDLEGWIMLGRSYVVLEQLPLAIRAYQRADELAGGRSVEALVGMAEALAMQDDSALMGRAGQLFERALELDPQAGKALFFGAVSALRRGDLPLARSRFVSLLALEPPANVRPVLEQQIAAIDAQLGEAGGDAAAGSAAAARSDAAAIGAGAPAVRSGAPAASAASVKVRVQLAPDLVAGVPANAPLFVFVRDAVAGGPPLAVRRAQANFPQLIELDEDDMMIAGRGFSAGQKVTVVARVARGGTPTASSGDPYGELRYDVGADDIRDIVIDRVTP